MLRKHRNLEKPFQKIKHLKWVSKGKNNFWRENRGRTFQKQPESIYIEAERRGCMGCAWGLSWREHFIEKCSEK